MQLSTGNKPPTGGMKLTVCTVRGEPMWKLETYSAGRRKRQFFREKGKADTALEDARRQQRAVGRAYDVLSAREKAELAAILAEIAQAGLTLPEVWKRVQAAPAAPRGSVSLAQAVAEVLAAKAKANRRPRHIANLRWYLGHFIKGRETADVGCIGVADLNEWFDARQEKPRAKKGHIALLSSLFSHCVRHGYIAENPVARLDPVHIDREIPAILTFRQAQRAILWAKCRKPKVLGWLSLALFAGLRPDAEADSIEWGDIDLDRARLIIRESKVRAARIMDLTFCPPALEWLRLAKSLDSPLSQSHSQRRRYMRQLGDHLGLKRWPQDILRHTAASNLLAYHQDAGKVAAFMGNSAGVLLRHYKALVFKEDAARFMNLLPRQRETDQL